MSIVLRIGFSFSLFGLFLVIVNERSTTPSYIGSVLVGIGVGLILTSRAWERFLGKG